MSAPAVGGSASACRARRRSCAASPRSADLPPWCSACITAGPPFWKPTPANRRAARGGVRRASEHPRVQRSGIAQPLLGAVEYAPRSDGDSRPECPQELGHVGVSRHGLRLVVPALAAEGVSTIWLVPAHARGIDGSGSVRRAWSARQRFLAGRATDVRVPRSAMLGADGKGFDIMMGIVLAGFLF